MKVVLILLAISVSLTRLQAADTHPSHTAMPAAGSRILASGGRMIAPGFYYNGYRPGEGRTNGAPLADAPRWRENRPGITQDTNLAKATTQESEPRLNGSNLAATPQSLSSTEATAQRRVNLPPGVKPQVSTPAERSQAVTTINDKFHQAETKMANKPSFPDRRNRLERSRVYFLTLIDWGYPFSLLDIWCDDLLDDQVDTGMPVDLIDSYWGQPVSTQDYEEYYNPYEVCTYQTPDGNYRQVTFQNGVVTQGM